MHDLYVHDLYRSRAALPRAGSAFLFRPPLLDASADMSAIAFAAASPPQARGGGAPEAGHWHVRHACGARRL